MVRKKKYFMLKPLVLLLGMMGWAGSAAANTAPAATPANNPYAGPFAQVPLHIIQTTHSSGIGVKPNVILQVDNSFSMYGLPNDYGLISYTQGALPPHDSRSRLGITKRAIKKLLANPQYRDTVNWQLLTLWQKPVDEYRNGKFAENSSAAERTNWWSAYAKDFLDGKKPFGRPPSEIEAVVDDLQATGYTPTTERYLDAIYLLQRALLRNDTYRCQKSFVVVFSDGAANGAGYNPSTRAFAAPQPKPFPKGSSGGKFRDSFYFDKDVASIVRAADVNKASGGGRGEQMLKFAHEQPMVYRHPRSGTQEFRNNFIRHHSEAVPSNKKLITEETASGSPDYGYRWSTHNVGGNSNLSLGSMHFWTGRSNALRYFAETVAESDLRPARMLYAPSEAPNSILAGAGAAQMGYKNQYLNDKDPSGASYDAPPHDKQTIETYTIAFGIDRNLEPRAFEYLSGGSTASGLKGHVFNASDEQSLDDAFSRIFSDVVGKSLFEPPASFSGISPTVSSDEATRKLPNMAATTHLSMKTGSSEIYFYEVDTANQSSTTVVKNRYTKPNFSNRRVLISDGKNTVTWLERFAGNNAFFGIPDAANNRDEWRRSMIPWIARSKADAQLNFNGNALKYRNRTDLHDGVIRNTRNMGDVVYSPILAYGPNENGRQKYLLTAANDGMVYLFRSHNDRNHPYDLKLNYIPAGMERESEDDTMGKHFKDIVHPEYVQNYKEAPHQFMVNGGFVIRTMDDTGPQQIFMAGNMGQGGRGMYALNVGGPSRANPGQQVGIDAPQDQWPQTVPLMETPKGSANRDMGYTINAPQIGRVALTRSVSKDPDKKAEMTTDLFDLRYAVFVGSGVSNPFARAAGGGADNTESALYLYSPFDNLNVGATPPAGQTSGSTAHHPLSKGQLIKKLAVEKSVGKGGLAQPTLVDINFDGAIDIVYAGDYGGGVYRFDLRGEPNDWTVHKIFQTVNGQPITSAPAVFRNEENKYIVVFGTGSDLYQSDLTDTNVQSMYGVYEDLTDFSPTVKYQSDLVQQTMTQSQVSVKGKNYDVRKLSDNGAEDPNIKGWYFDFPAGERVVVKPNVLLKSVLFTTRSYRLEREQSGNLGTGDKCSAETSSERSSGESWVMQVKVDNGGNIPGKDGDEAYAYADFLGQYERAPDSDKYTRPDELFAGFRSEGGIVNMALLFGVNKDPNGVGGINSAYTRDGDAGDSGIDPPPAADGNHLNNITKFCVDDDDNKLLYNNTGDSKGLSDNFVLIHASKCPSQQKGIVRRLSWRELF